MTKLEGRMRESRMGREREERTKERLRESEGERRGGNIERGDTTMEGRGGR